MLARGITATGPPRLRSSGALPHVALLWPIPSPIGQRHSPCSLVVPPRQCQLSCIVAASTQDEGAHAANPGTVKRRGRRPRTRKDPSAILTSTDNGSCNYQNSAPLPNAEDGGLSDSVGLLSEDPAQDVARGTNSSLGQLLGSDFEPPSTLPRTSRVKRKTHDETSKADKPRRGRPRKQVGHNTAPVGSVTEALSPAPEGDREAQRSALGTSHSLTVTGDGWDADLLSDDPPVASPSVPVFRKPVPVESSSMHTVNMHPAVSHNSGTSDDSPAPTSLGRPVSDDTLAANHSASPSDDTRASILSPRPSDTTPATSRALKTPEDTPSSSLTPHAHTKKDTDDETRGNKPTKLTRRGLARLLASTDDDGSEWDMAQLLLMPEASEDPPSVSFALRGPHKEDTGAQTSRGEPTTSTQWGLDSIDDDDELGYCLDAALSDMDDYMDSDSDHEDEPTASLDETAPYKLTEEQEKAVELVRQGKNILLTGPAGTGKTVTLRSLLEVLQDIHGSAFDKRVAVCALTGIAATPLEGTTVHSKFGLGMFKIVKDLFNMQKRHVKRKIRQLEVLVLDEISMASAEMIEILDYTLRKLRSSYLPFGGLQLIFCGDMAQLPPIFKQEFQHDINQSVSDRKDHPGFIPFKHNHMCFQASVWGSLNLHYVQLTRVMRQADAEFVGYLMDIRQGGPKCAVALKKLGQLASRPLPPEALATKLYRTNAKVDACNADALAALPGEEREFQAIDMVEVDESIHKGSKAYDTAKNNLLRSSFFTDPSAPKLIKLKINCQVMLVKNLDVRRGLVNGAVGKVIDFTVNEKGQTTPIVMFHNGTTEHIDPLLFDCELPDGKCFREQVPLKLAWAITVHKSQGMSLDYVQVDLSDAYGAEHELVYVALSRVRSLQGLQIVSLPRGPMAMEPNPLVTRFYQAIEDEQAIRALISEEGNERQKRAEEVYAAIDATWWG